MEKLIIDRFEGEFAVLEKQSGGTVDVLKKKLPDVKTGDVLIYENGTYTVDEEETLRRKKLIKEKLHKLFENN